MKYIYCDYAATTPLDPEIEKIMSKNLTQENEGFGNPSSTHWYGQQAQKVIDDAREIIAESVCADRKDIIFTGSATESNNLFIRGAIKYFKRHNPKKIPHIIISSIEHASIYTTVKEMEWDGEVEVTHIPVLSNGYIDLEKLKTAIKKETILCSIQWTNNEIGVVQPIEKIVEILSTYKKENNLEYPLFHTDAVQAFLYEECTMREGIDAMTLSAHKAYGPKGVGILIIKKKELIEPIITGGGQEYGLRSGTQNVAGILGAAHAIKNACTHRTEERKKIKHLSEYFERLIQNELPNIQIFTTDTKSPHIVHCIIPGIERGDIVLDMQKVAVSVGSACAQRTPEYSHVLSAIGYSEQQQKESVRFSFGKWTTEDELIEIVKRIKAIYSAQQKN